MSLFSHSRHCRHTRVSGSPEERTVARCRVYEYTPLGGVVGRRAQGGVVPLGQPTRASWRSSWSRSARLMTLPACAAGSGLAGWVVGDACGITLHQPIGSPLVRFAGRGGRASGQGKATGAHSSVIPEGWSSTSQEFVYRVDARLSRLFPRPLAVCSYLSL